MTEIHDLLDRETHRVEPSSDWMKRTLAKVTRRRRRRAVATAGVALALAAGGLLVAVRAFSAPQRPADTPPANYEMIARLATEDDPIEGTSIRGSDFVWIHVDVRWQPERYPGVHRCTWQVLDEDGIVLSERKMLYAPYTPDTSSGAESFHLKMLDLTGEPVAATASCAGERLDVPGVADLDPFPETKNYEATIEELARRLEAWAERFGIREMAPEHLAGNMWAIRKALRETAIGSQEWVAIRELMMRSHALCVLLPPEHEFRGGEFCD
jgi:hypothetical protein